MELVIRPADAGAETNPPCTTYERFTQLMAAENAEHTKIIRITEPGTKQNTDYTGFFFYQCLQFDSTGRYVLGMRVLCQNRGVRPTDQAEIGFTDLEDGCKWTRIGDTTAWNCQQGARLQCKHGSRCAIGSDGMA